MSGYLDQGSITRIKHLAKIGVQTNLSIANLGNTHDAYRISLSDSSSEYVIENWTVTFQDLTQQEIDLNVSETGNITIKITIPSETSIGNYTLIFNIQSMADPQREHNATITIVILPPAYSPKLIRTSEIIPKVNPQIQNVISYTFSIMNIGTLWDSFTIRVETPTYSGTYYGWMIFFIDKNSNFTPIINVPEDIRKLGFVELTPGEEMNLTLNVFIPMDISEGIYPDITISAVSNHDPTLMETLNFTLEVIKPNIRFGSLPEDITVISDQPLQKGDDVQIECKVFNDGSADTGPFYLRFFDGEEKSVLRVEGNDFAQYMIQNIPAHSTMYFTVTWFDIPAGLHTVFVEADKPIRFGPTETQIDGKYSFVGLVSETRENDNTASMDVYVLDSPPELVISEIRWIDIHTGQICKIFVTVSNVGSHDYIPPTARLNVNINGEPIKNLATEHINPQITRTIKASEEYQMVFYWEVPNTGLYNVAATLEYRDDPFHYESSLNRNFQTQSALPEEEREDDSGIDPQWGMCMAISLVILIAAGNFLIHGAGDLRKNKKKGTHARKVKQTTRKRSLEQKAPRLPRDKRVKAPTPFFNTKKASRDQSVKRKSVLSMLERKETEDWTCKRCGSSWPPEKTLCWDCGKKRKS